ncbi:hypothetical protein [Hyphomicrobium sp.]|uniref:hypothetical protein n=1 Tax=Hyphomicrobium sp. TaxID=82 RepID=UPI000F909410|nr:hypothetical protein [Hyphomicrobium sp.]RUO97828.1 MAG: hypothetical protein EKK30_13900 [Hyphomicrobium sp.]
MRADFPVRVGLERTSNVIGYLAILGAAICGYAAVGAWAVLVAALALASLSQAEYGALYRRSAELGLGSLGFSVAMKSLGNALLASGGAYVGGVLLRLL